MKIADKKKYYISRMTSKGQTTIPKEVRDILGLKDGSEIAFKPETGGFMLVRVTTTVKENDPYTPGEWKKIKELASKKGKSFKSEEALLKFLRKA
ncbi:MAG: AbrB/MazE/SpoVT family DNA-binding domain-containing protein [Candidatus Omnitrophota bacterium]